MIAPEELADRARALAAGAARTLLGIAGPPGAGKSTVAARLVRELGASAVLVPMDGFHLDDAVLAQQGLLDRKGAPSTFDAEGYVALLRRLAQPTDSVVYAPLFDRERELSLAGALAVPADVPLVITEGNYLLMDGAFAAVRTLLTQCWYVDLDPQLRRLRLVERHERHGRSPADAAAWVEHVDEPNALLVEATRDRADLVLRPA